MDAKTSNFLFIGLFLIFISPCTQQDEIASVQDQEYTTDNWITIKADDWIKTDDITKAKPFFVKLFRGQTADSLKFHPNLIKLKPNGDPVKFSLKYWIDKENYGFQFFDNRTQTPIDLKPDENQPEEFITNDGFAQTKFTFDDLKQSELIPAFRTLDQIILLQDVTVDYSDFRNLTTNFIRTTANNEMEFVFSSTNEWGQIQQVFEKDQFDRICIETNLTNFQMYLSMENDDYVKLVSQAYSDSFSKTNGLYLNEIFAINPNGRFMIVVKVLESLSGSPKEYSMNFHLRDANEIVPKNPEDAPFNDWIYNVDLPNIYDFELKQSDGKADFYACDSAATCYQYQKISVTEYELNETDRNSLKSPIIKRIAIPHDAADTNFELEESFSHKILKNRFERKTTNISDDQATIEVNKNQNLLNIPYIDLRVYEPTVKFDPSISVQSISITSKSAPQNSRSEISFEPSMKAFFTDNKIDLGRFFHPRIGDMVDFNDYQLSFNFTADENRNQVVIKLENKTNPFKIAEADGCATVQDGSQKCLKESDWKMAPITSTPNSIKLGDAVFEFDGTDGSKQIQINHQIQFYDGTGTEPTVIYPSTNSKITYPIEGKINGPYKVFYWITMPKGVSLKSYSDNFKNITNEDEKQIKKGPTNAWYDPEYDPMDNSNCPIGFKWNASKQRCFLQVYADETKNHLSTTIKCNESNGCTNIFDKPLMGSSVYSNGSELELIGQDDFNALSIKSILIPFVDPTNHINRISIPIKTESGKDFCIDFKHFGYESQLYAFGETDPEYKILFEDDKTSMKKHNYLYKEDSICASDLSPEPIDQIKSIVLTIEYNPKVGGPLKQSIADLKLSKPKSSPKSINQWIEQDESDKLKKFSKYDADFFVKDSKNIIFRLEKAQLAPEQENFQRILSTKFLPLYKDGKNKTIDIGLSYDGDFTDLGGEVSIQFRPESKSKYNIEMWKTQSMQHIVYEPKDPVSLVEYVQVQFVFHIKNLTEMKDKMNATSFTIQDLSIDDPCVGEGNSLTDFCSGLPGACERQFKSSPWSKWHKCNCPVKQFRYGDECQNTDFCKEYQKTEYCLQKNYGKCANDQTKNSWHCTCDGASTWIPIGEYCSKKIDIDKCPENEIIMVKDLETPECVCEDGRVRINQKCVEFDVCNADHRNASGLSPEKPCADQYAECRKTSFSEYQCVCKDSLTNKEGKFDQNAQCIDQLCNLNLKCEQKCHPNSTDVKQSKCQCFNDNYEMDEDQKHCKIKTKFESEEKDCLPSEDVEKLSVFERAYLQTSPDKKCRCKLDGYEFNSNSKKCEAPKDKDKDKVKKILHCEKIKMDEDDQPVCVCPIGQAYNHDIGKCSYESCPQPDQIRFIFDQEHPDQSECLDACDEKLVQQCNDHFARCNKTKLIEKLRESVTNQNDVLVFTNGTDQILDQTMYCDCIVGFHNSSGKCEADVNRSMMTVELSFINTEDKQQTMNYLEKILKQIFPQNMDIESINCEDSGNCQVSMVAESTMKPETVKQSIENQCLDENELKKNGGKSENCVYILKKKNSEDFMIVLSKSKSASIKCEIDRCFSDPCKRFRHTECATEPSDTFSCKCIYPYEKVESKPITKGEIETCALRNCNQEGEHCDDPSAKCMILAPEDDDDILSKFSSKSPTVQDGGLRKIVICICNDGYILPNTSAHCDELRNCDLDCHQHGKCYFEHDDPKTISKTCRCDKGWTGDLCEKEIDNNHNHDKNNTIVVNNQSNSGFKISTIVLAVLSALLVVGVVYLFMKK